MEIKLKILSWIDMKMAMPSKVLPMVEISVWNMDHLANKKIKITRVAGRNVMTLSDKEVRSFIRKGFFGNKKFYSTTALWSHASCFCPYPLGMGPKGNQRKLRAKG